MINHTCLTLSLIAFSISQAIAAPITSTVNITNGQNVTLSDNIETHNEYGVAVNGENSTLTSDGISITTEGDNALGIRVMNQGHAIFKNGTIQTNGSGSYGISAENSGSLIELDNVNIIAEGSNSYGALSASQGKINANNLSVTTKNSNSNGISSINSGSSVALNNTTVNTQGNTSHGIYSAEKQANVSATALTIHTQGSLSYGIDQTNQSHGYFNNTTITTEGKNSAAVNTASGATTILNNLFIKTYGDHSDAFKVNSGNLTITQNNTVNLINTYGTNSSAIDLAGKSTLNIQNSSLVGSGSNNHIYTIHNGASVINSSGNTLQSTGALIQAFGGNSIINMQGDYATNATGGLMDIRSASATKPTSVTLNADNQTLLAGNIVNDEHSTAILNLSNQSEFSGNVQNLTQTNVSENSQLLLNGNSNIGTTHLDKGSLIFTQNSSRYPTLHTQTLSGNGSILFDTTLGSDHSNTTKITADNISGNYKVYVHNLGGQGAYTRDEGINIIQANHENTASYALGAPVYAGVYEYLLHRHGNDIYLQNELPVKPTVPDVKPTPNPSKPPLTPPTTQPDGNSDTDHTPSYRPAVPGYLLATYLDQNYGYLSVGTLHERTGNALEPQQQNKDSQRMWSRAFTNKTQTNHYRFDFTSYTNFYQIGYDLKHESDVAEPVYAGITFEVGHAHNKTYDEKRIDGQFAGKVNVDAIGIGAYYTRYLNHNDYIDIVGKGIRYKNHYSAKAENNQTQNASSLLLSMEYGKDFTIKKYFHIEPQIQAIYQFNHANSITDSYIGVSKENTQTGQVRLGSAFYSN
ncbi:MAG: autotransporter outer membrane beta-barrel domain-containing protein, partial [Plesiomonas sp.]